jgi:FkbM family methyltransferase
MRSMQSLSLKNRLAKEFSLISTKGIAGWAAYRLERLCCHIFPEEREFVSALGLAGWISNRRERSRHDRAQPGEIVEFTSRHAKHPLKCRARTSDINMFKMIMVEREYSCLDDITEPDLIIDCGANVGYSSAYLLSRFPRCDLIALEAYPPNFDVLRLNLIPYGARAKPMLAAVWSHPTCVTSLEVKYRSGLEATKQVRECRPEEEGGIPAIDIGNLLRDSGHHRIAILKVDIEGAEAVVFSSTSNYEGWLDQVDNLVIELHDDSNFGNSSEIFSRAIAGRGFDVSRYGELTVCKRRGLGEHTRGPAGHSEGEKPSACACDRGPSDRWPTIENVAATNRAVSETPKSPSP